jgi:hypothetical protein
MRNFVTGFTGKMRSGKTTASDYLLKNYADHVKVNFKDALIAELWANFRPLIEEVCAQEGILPEDIFAVKPPVIRKLLQGYGTEVRRKDDPNYWINKWKEAVQKQLDAGKWVVCDDVRFINEGDAIRDMGGIVVRITRPDITDTGTHLSETEMDSISVNHIIVTAQGDLAALYKSLDELV